jgi:ABC-type uncharacterized transport system auxiliary subunit
MKHRWIASSLAVLLLACGSVPARYYFTLSYPLDRDRVTESRPPIHPVRLRIKPFKVGVPYDRPQIVYRQSPFEYQYYTFRLWAAKPQHMVREIIENHLESCRLVTEVSREYGEHLPDFELGGEIEAIEEYDSGDVWYGHLAMRLELVRFSDQMPLWHYAFDRKARVYKKQPVYVVRALSRIVEEEMRRIAAELDRVISNERKVPATLVLPPPSQDDAPALEGIGPQVIPPTEPSPPPAVRPATKPPVTPASPPPSPDELIVPEEGDGR